MRTFHIFGLLILLNGAITALGDYFHWGWAGGVEGPLFYAAVCLCGACCILVPWARDGY